MVLYHKLRCRGCKNIDIGFVVLGSAVVCDKGKEWIQSGRVMIEIFVRRFAFCKTCTDEGFAHVDDVFGINADVRKDVPRGHFLLWLPLAKLRSSGVWFVSAANFVRIVSK